MSTKLMSFDLIKSEQADRISAIETFKKAPVTRKAQTIATVAVVGGIGILATVFALQIITGMFALVVTAATAGAGWYGLRWIKYNDPMIKQKMKNKVIERMYQEASEKAIEQLTNQVLDNQQKLTDSRNARDRIGALVENLRSSVAKASEANKPKMQRTLDKLEQAYASIKINVDKAAVTFKQFEQKVAEYREMDRFNKEAGVIINMLEEDANDKLAEMLSLESFNSIEMEFNSAIISIENSAKDAEISYS